MRFGLEDPDANRSPYKKTKIELWAGGEHSEDLLKIVYGMRRKVLQLTCGDLMSLPAKKAGIINLRGVRSRLKHSTLIKIGGRTSLKSNE